LIIVNVSKKNEKRRKKNGWRGLSTVSVIECYTGLNYYLILVNDTTSAVPPCEIGQESPRFALQSCLDATTALLLYQKPCEDCHHTMEGATSTLADNLLDDLDDLSDAVEDQDDEGQPKEQKRDDNGDEGDDDDDDDDAVNKKASPPQAGLTNDLPRLLQDASLRSHLTAIRAWGVQNPSNSKEDAEREYKLIVKSNKWLARLGDELVSTHVTLRQVYDAKFPELADLLPDARQYQQAVEVIGNETDMTKVNDSLHEFLTANQVITLTVAGSTTAGRLLTEAELQRCQELAHYMNQIHETQNELTDFVASRMQDLAPAVCALTGPEVAAKLIALAGGLVELSVIPACNLQVMGQSKQTSTSRAGFGSQAAQPHMGLLMHAPLVQSVPQGERRKVLKWLAAKVALAARCDATAVQQRRPRSALPGERFREELQKKIQVLQTPDQAPVLKALPK